MTGGVTGHQHIGGPGDVEWTRGEIDRIVEEERVAYGLTCLAVGADQLFAEVLLARRIPFGVVVPCERYEDTFASEEGMAEYRRLLGRAEEVHRLGYEVCGENAFWAAGQVVVNESDIMIAVWDGKVARGLGGTGDVVEYARNSGRVVVQIDVGARRVRAVTGM